MVIAIAGEQTRTTTLAVVIQVCTYIYLTMIIMAFICNSKIHLINKLNEPQYSDFIEK